MSFKEDVQQATRWFEAEGDNAVQSAALGLMSQARDAGSEQRMLRMLAISMTLMKLWLVKNTKYDDSFTKTVKKRGLIAALTRLEDKWNRFVGMVEGGDGSEDESILDTSGDAANYFMMTIDAIVNEGVES